MKYVCKFERIGRDHYVPPLEVECPEDDADAIAEAVFRYARTKLASSWFEVLVDLESNRVSIEMGRFGVGTVAVA